MRRQTSCAKAFASGQDNLSLFEVTQRRDDVETFAASCLAKADETKGVQALAHFAGSFNHDRESHIRSRIKIEYQTTGDFRLGRLTVPGMQLEGRDLSDSRETLNPIDLQIRLAVAKDRNKFEQIGRARHGMALEELLTVKAIRGSDD